jgi:hypothetical protein
LKEVLYQGPVTQFLVSQKDSGAAPLLVTQPNTAVTARKSLSAGERVFVAWSPEDCLVMNSGGHG